MKLFHSRHHDSPTLGGGVIVHPTDHPSAMLVIDAHASHSQRGSSDFRTADHSGEYRPAEFALDASRHHGELTHPARSPSPTSSVTDQKARARRSAQFGAGSSSGSSSNSCPANDNDNNDDSRTSSPTNTSPTSKRALHLEHHESECPVANPDPHSRPRSRQFFRLGRNRYKGIDKASHGNKAAGPYAGCTSSDSSDGEDNNEAGMVRKNNRRSSTTVAGSNKAKLTLRKPRMRRSQSLPTDINSKSKVVVEGGSSSSSSSDPAKAEFMSASERLPPNAALDSTDKLSLSVPAARTHRRHVTFTSVSIREYSTILGDHPCCPSGPPLSLGWELERENSMEFETYERVREPIRVKTKEDMRLDGDVRRDILQSLVVTSPCANGDEAGGSSSSDKEEDGDNIEKKQCCAMYSDRDLRLAERRCQRERSNNSRMNRRMNRGFFRTPLTAEESDGPVITATEEEPGSPMNEDRTQAVGSNERCAAGEGSCSMDISPIKLPFSFAADDDSDTMVESSP